MCVCVYVSIYDNDARKRLVYLDLLKVSDGIGCVCVCVWVGG